MKPYLVQYKEAIDRGWIEIDGVKTRLVVGWKIKKVVYYLVSLMDDDRFYFDPTDCYRRFKFEETLCLQGKKPYYGKPISLMLWQKAIFEAVYSFFDKSTGKRLFNRILIEVGRKNGKSTMMASDINADLFIGDGGQRICCASNEDKTAKFIWDEVLGMKKRLDPKDEVTAKNLSTIRNESRDISVVRMSGKSVNDGDLFAKVVQDEGWDCKTDELPEACERSCSTLDDYLYFIISTNGFLNDMWFDHQLEYANKWLEGEVDDIHYIPFLFEQDSEDEIWGSDRDVWQKANPSLIYGVKKWSFIENNMVKARVDKATALNLLCKDFNVKVNNSRAWLTLDQYTYEQEEWSLEDFRGGLAIGATDLSDTGDLTTASALFMKPDSDEKFVVMQFFAPEHKLAEQDSYGSKWKEWSTTINPQTGEPYIIACKGTHVNQKDVADWYQRLRDRYSIEPYVIGYDKWFSQSFLIWCDKKTGYGLKTEPVYQGKYLSFPMKMVERDLNARLINYGNNPVLRYCFANTSVKITSDENIQPVKIDGQYERKIDGAVTLMMLYATLSKNETTFVDYVRR